MDTNKNEQRQLEFEILGQKVKLRPQGGEYVEAGKIVDLINREAAQIKMQNKDLDNAQLAILVSLKVASDKISLENDYKNSIEQFGLTASDALHLLNKISSETTKV